MIEWLASEGIGEKKVNYKLRDWLISRQRYWGTPIPMIYCQECGWVPEKEENLPVLLPTDVEFTGKGESPLTTSATFADCTCPRCGKKAKREMDTMDTFLDSSWYFLRYCDPKNEQEAFAREIPRFGEITHVEFSALTGQGVDELRSIVEEIAGPAEEE